MVRTNAAWFIMLCLCSIAAAIPRIQTDVSVPDVLLLEPSAAGVTSDTPSLRIRAVVRSRIPLVGVIVTLNGATIFKQPIEGSEKERQRYVIDFETPPLLRPGKNLIEINARNEKALAKSVATTVVYEPRTQSSKGQLAVLAIGVSRSKDSALNSKTAAASAQAFAKLMSSQQREGGIFDSVNTKVLIDEDATRESILQGLKWLQSQNRTPNDLSILFLSGNLDAEYADASLYFLTAEHQRKSDFEIVDISFPLFWEVLGRGGGNTIIFSDACWMDAGPKYLFQRMTRFLNNERIISFFSSDNGVLSTGDERSPYSVFTMALLEGLQGKADVSFSGDPDHIIDTNELQFWMIRRMQALTGGKQNPVIQVSQTPVAIFKVSSP